MSGVNAHMLLSAGAREGSSAAGAAPLLPWQRQRYWPAAAPHPLLQLVSSMGSTAQFSCLFGSASSTFLRDHCISGRLLVPAAAFFELLLAAAGSTAEDSAKRQAQLSLTGVAILAPKILSREASAASDAVQVSLQLSSGTAEVLSADGSSHVRGSVCAAATLPVPLVAGSGIGASGAARLLLVCGQTSGAAPGRHNFAAISGAAAFSSGSGWSAHPAAADAALHLAAVKVAGQGDGASRVPVAVAAVAVAAASGGSTQQWSASELPVVAADRSAVCTISAQLAGGCFSASGLHSTPLPSKPAGVAPADAAAEAKAFEQRNFTYAIQWQAAAEAAAAQCASLVPVASSNSVHLLASQSGLPAALSSADRLAIVAGRRSPSSPMAAATGTVEMLQRILAAGGTAAVHAVTTAASPSPAAARTCMASSVLGAALKVAAVENPSRQWGALLIDSQQRPHSSGTPLGTADQHGALLSAGALCHPKLLRQPM